MTPSITAIQAAVCVAYDITPHEMLSPRGVRHVARARHVAMWLSRRLTDRSYPAIGAAFAGRDHTTVMHAVSRIDRDMSVDPRLRAQVATIQESLQVET